MSKADITHAAKRVIAVSSVLMAIACPSTGAVGLAKCQFQRRREEVAVIAEQLPSRGGIAA